MTIRRTILITLMSTILGCGVARDNKSGEVPEILPYQTTIKEQQATIDALQSENREKEAQKKAMELELSHVSGSLVASQIEKDKIKSELDTVQIEKRAAMDHSNSIELELKKTHENMSNTLSSLNTTHEELKKARSELATTTNNNLRIKEKIALLEARELEIVEELAKQRLAKEKMEKDLNSKNIEVRKLSGRLAELSAEKDKNDRVITQSLKPMTGIYLSTSPIQDIVGSDCYHFVEIKANSMIFVGITCSDRKLQIAQAAAENFIIAPASSLLASSGFGANLSLNQDTCKSSPYSKPLLTMIGDFSPSGGPGLNFQFLTLLLGDQKIQLQTAAFDFIKPLPTLDFASRMTTARGNPPAMLAVITLLTLATPQTQQGCFEKDYKFNAI